MKARLDTISAAVFAASILALSACGGSGSSAPEVASLDRPAAAGAEAADNPGTGEAPDDPQEAILAFVECLRGEGFDAPDPDFSRGPGQGGGLLGQAGIDPSDREFQAAQQKCRPLLGNIQQRFTPEQRQAFQDAALAFAQCLREHGIDAPDPDFSQGGPGPGGGGGGLFGQAGVDPDDADVQAAIDACSNVFTDAGLPGPPGSGPPGQQGGGQ